MAIAVEHSSYVYAQVPDLEVLREAITAGQQTIALTIVDNLLALPTTSGEIRDNASFKQVRYLCALTGFSYVEFKTWTRAEAKQAISELLEDGEHTKAGYTYALSEAGKKTIAKRAKSNAIPW